MSAFYLMQETQIMPTASLITTEIGGAQITKDAVIRRLAAHFWPARAFHGACTRVVNRSHWNRIQIAE
jgi:hypothetical protein